MTFPRTIRHRRHLLSDEKGGDNLEPLDGFALDPEDLARLLEGSASYVEVESSELLRVVGIGDVSDDGVVRVELTSLELRGAGAILHWKAQAVPAAMLGNAELVVRDDQGTEYRALASGGGGSPDLWSGEAIITPLPEDGSNLEIEFRGFEGFGAWIPGAPQSPPIRGSWRFVVRV